MFKRKKPLNFRDRLREQMDLVERCTAAGNTYLVPRTFEDLSFTQAIREWYADGAVSPHRIAVISGMSTISVKHLLRLESGNETH